MFQWTSFGKVKYKDEIYDDDIWVDIDGNAYPRQSVGDHHYLTREELEKYLTDDLEAIVFGTGQSGCCTIPKDTYELIDKHHFEVHAEETPEAIKKYNEIAGTRKTIAIIHVTC